MKGRLIREARKQYDTLGTLDCVIHMDLTNAGIDPEALIETFERGK